VARTVGAVDFTVDFDGKTLPRQARAIGERLGRQLSRNMQNEFDKDMGSLGRRMNADMRLKGDEAGVEFSHALRNSLRSRRAGIASTLASMVGDRRVFESFVRNSGDVERGLDRVTESLKRAHSQGVINDRQFRSMSMTFRNWGGVMREDERRTGRLRREMERLATATSRLGSRLRVTNRENERFFSQWKSMPHGLRQALLIVGAIAAGGPEIASLGSLIGSTLFVSLTTLAAMGAAVAVIVAGFQNMTGDLKKIAPAARPAATELKKVGDAFGGLQKVIQGSLFENLAGPLATIRDLIKQITDPLSRFASSVGDDLGRLITALTSDSSAEKIGKLLDGFAPIVSSITTALISFGSGFGNVLVESLPSAQKFADAIADIGQDFLDWTKSAGGRQAIAEWFENGRKLAKPLLKLIGAAGELLSNLVTPKAIEQTGRFLDNLTKFMDPLTTILDAIGQLDLFGIAADALASFGDALKPVWELLKPIASILNTLFQVLISSLSPLLSTIALFLTPMIWGFQVLATLFEKLWEKAQPFVDLMAELVQEVFADLMDSFDELMPLIDGLADDLLSLLPPTDQWADIIRNQLVPWIKNDLVPGLMQWIEGVKGIITWMRDILIPWLRDVFIPWVIGTLLPALGKIWAVFEVIVTWIGNTIKGFQDLITIAGRVAQALGLIKAPKAFGNIGGGDPIKFASGGFVNTPTRALIGENGPELVVPLTRPLGQVDRSVRNLSAILRGRRGTSTTNSQRTVIVEDGAIRIESTGDAGQAASAVLDRFVAKAA
jgi:phage-related protein